MRNMYNNKSVEKLHDTFSLRYSTLQMHRYTIKSIKAISITIQTIEAHLRSQKSFSLVQLSLKPDSVSTPPPCQLQKDPKFTRFQFISDTNVARWRWRTGTGKVRGIITRSLTHAHLLHTHPSEAKDRCTDSIQRRPLRSAHSSPLSGSFSFYLPELISDNVEFNSDHRTIPLWLVLRRAALRWAPLRRGTL